MKMIDTTKELFELNKLVVKDLSKDIKFLKKRFDGYSNQKNIFENEKELFLEQKNYGMAKICSKNIKRLEKQIEGFECAIKTIEATRRPYEYMCIRLRQLGAVEYKLSNELDKMDFYESNQKWMRKNILLNDVQSEIEELVKS